MDKRFLNEVADKIENVQFLGAELDKTRGHDVDGVKADYEEACADLERTLFDWVEMQTQDPVPDEPEKTSEFYRSVADKADELVVLLADMSDELTEGAKRMEKTLIKMGAFLLALSNLLSLARRKGE